MLPRVLPTLVAVSALVSTLLVAPVGSTAAAAPAPVDDCLTRSAIVPVDSSPADELPLARAAALRSLQHALLQADPDGLAGIELRFDEHGAATGLDVLQVAPGTVDARLPAALAQLPEHQSALVSAVDVAVVGSAEHSLRALCEGLETAISATGPAADAIVSAAVDHGRAALRIGVERESAAAAAPAATASIDELPDADSGTPEPAAEPLLDALGLGGSAVPIELVADVADSPVSRLDDRDGYGAGMAVRVEGIACTSGFAVRTADRADALMSAGHCPRRDGHNGAWVTTGFDAAVCGSAGAIRNLGRVSQNLLLTSSRTDTMIVRANGVTPTMWLGGACTGSREVAVHGTGIAGPGQRIGFSGVRQGEQYATRTWEPAGCFDFGYWACGVFRGVSPSSRYACYPGDSGGPAFRHRDGGGVYAAGIISASGYDIGLNRCSYTDMATALHLSGATIMTQASTTMAPPTRIAGGNRYETSVEISRHGFAGGARQTYVASGELFPDALSAGAAAAHIGAPLLLTARGQLPERVRAELQRLAPASIVLVGGTPSVSLAVEEQLAAIAPVTRLAGANRYETSALIARHAFPSATTAYLATGRSFPDALSAGPAAALRSAPVLLVDGAARSAPQPTIDVLAELGVTRISVVGGIPSVATAVADSIRAGRAVERIGGANRFETAVRVNAAFSGRPAALYVASGERFPDALAAAAVAGHRGSPLYLTRAVCLEPAVQAAHSRLSRPPVVLLGGTPSLSHQVTRYEVCG